MENEVRLIHDTGRVPLLLRLPIALAGLFMLWFAAHELALHAFGSDFGFHTTGESGSPVLGFIVALGLGMFFVSVWFLRNRIFFDAAQREILVRHAGLFSRSVRRIALSDATGVYVRPGRVVSGRFCDIGIAYKDGRREWLTRVYGRNDDVVRRLSESIQLPVLET